MGQAAARQPTQDGFELECKKISGIDCRETTFFLPSDANEYKHIDEWPDTRSLKSDIFATSKKKDGSILSLESSGNDELLIPDRFEDLKTCIQDSVKECHAETQRVINDNSKKLESNLEEVSFEIGNHLNQLVQVLQNPKGRFSRGEFPLLMSIDASLKKIHEEVGSLKAEVKNHYEENKHQFQESQRETEDVIERSLQNHKGILIQQFGDNNQAIINNGDDISEHDDDENVEIEFEESSIRGSTTNLSLIDHEVGDHVIPNEGTPSFESSDVNPPNNLIGEDLEEDGIQNGTLTSGTENAQERIIQSLFELEAPKKKKNKKMQWLKLKRSKTREAKKVLRRNYKRNEREIRGDLQFLRLQNEQIIENNTKNVLKYEEVLHQRQMSCHRIETNDEDEKAATLNRMAYDWATGKWKMNKSKHFKFALVVDLLAADEEDDFLHLVKRQHFNNVNMSLESLQKVLAKYKKNIVFLLHGYERFQIMYGC